MSFTKLSRADAPRPPLLAVLPRAAARREPGGDGPRVVATTTQLADMARNVAPSAQVTTLLKANTDPHEYEVRPRDVKALAKADVVLRSGGETDEWLDGALDSAGVDTRRSSTPGGRPGSRATTRTGGRTRAAPSARWSRSAARSPAPIRRRTWRGCARSTRRSRAVCDTVPRAQRRLVTSHDALGYFARRYGIDVVGTVIPALSTSAQPSAGDVTRLVDTIRSAGVKTIFAESSVNPKVEQAIAREAGARVGPPLWADSLGAGRHVHRLDRGQHARAGGGLHRAPRGV